MHLYLGLRVRTGVIWFGIEFRDEQCGADDGFSIRNQHDGFYSKIKSPHVSSITFSSSGGTTLTVLGILRVCYVSWLHLVHARNIPSAVCAAPPEDK
jgi:hypothetical protein